MKLQKNTGEYSLLNAFLCTSSSSSGSMIVYISRKCPPQNLEIVLMPPCYKSFHFSLDAPVVTFTLVFATFHLQIQILLLNSSLYMCVSVCICAGNTDIHTCGCAYMSNRAECLIFLAPLSSISLSHFGNINI